MAKSETVARLHVKDFTAFSDVTMDFVPGVNVLIGENSTGKSHVMKLVYAMVREVEPNLLGHPPALAVGKPEGINFPRLQGVFRPGDGDVDRLIRQGESTAKMRLDFSSPKRFVAFNFGNGGRGQHCVFRCLPSPIFIPSHEALSMYEGFTSAYEKRELSFDETYYDLCKALGATPLKGEAAETAKELLQPLEKSLGGKIVLKGQRFYLQPPEKTDGMLEAHLLAEGHRKIGALAHLIANGSIDANTVLFWDEPEANLNPRLTNVLIHVLLALAAKGVQVILATHDFLVAHELSMLADYGRTEGVPVRFFLMSREKPNAPVTVEQADSLSDLAGNPILVAYAAHYDRERDLFASAK